MTTATTTTTATPIRSAPAFSLRRLAVFALAGAIVNLIAFAVGSAVGASMVVMTPERTAIGAPVVIVASLIPLLLAGVMTWLLARRFPVLRIWAAWAGLGLAVLSAPAPFLNSADVATAVTLAVMHIVAGVAWFAALTTGSRMPHQ